MVFALIFRTSSQKFMKQFILVCCVQRVFVFGALRIFVCFLAYGCFSPALEICMKRFTVEVGYKHH